MFSLISRSETLYVAQLSRKLLYISRDVVLSKKVFQYSGSVGRGTLRSLRKDESKDVSTKGVSTECSVPVVSVPATEGRLCADDVCALLEVTSPVMS